MCGMLSVSYLDVSAVFSLPHWPMHSRKIELLWLSIF